MTSTEQHPAVLLTAPGGEVTVPRWIASFRPEVASEMDVRKLVHLRGLTVVRVATARTMLAREDFLRILAERLGATPRPSKIVFAFDRRGQIGVPEMTRLLRYFRMSGERSSDIEFARGSDEASFILLEAIAKIDAAASPVPELSPLRGLTSVIEATAPLRRPSSGRLSARRIAEAFKLSLSGVATAIGKSRQSVTKTPDGLSIQEGLRLFERIYQLRALLSQEGFLAFLNMPNDELDGKTPLDLIRKGRPAIVADLVEDMLTGSPA
jgi:hypothetical protein